MNKLKFVLYFWQMDILKYDATKDIFLGQS
jgi:hypothetical protein